MELLKKQLEQLESGILPDFQKRAKKIEQRGSEWLRLINLRLENETHWAERQVIKEKETLNQEFIVIINIYFLRILCFTCFFFQFWRRKEKMN